MVFAKWCLLKGVDRAVAERMVQLGDEVTKLLNQILTMGQPRLPGDEFDAARLAVGTIAVSVQMDVLRPVYLRYRDLDKYGHFRRLDQAPPPGNLG